MANTKRLRDGRGRFRAISDRHDPLYPGQHDAVEFGSDDHAALLGLRKVEEGAGELEYEGWTLIDIGVHGPNATDRYLMNILRGKVNQLSKPPEMQSEDPRIPNYAPPMWEMPEEKPTYGMV